MEKLVEQAVEWIKKAEKPLVVTHVDADGIVCGALCTITMERLLKRFVLAWCDVFTKKIADNIAKYNPDLVWIADMGSADFELIEPLITKGIKVLVTDHHQQKSKWPEHESIINLNCNLYGIDGGTEACGAAVTYLIAKQLCDPATLSPMVVIAAIGDKQAHRGLIGLNRSIAKVGMDAGLIQQHTGLMLFGRNTLGLPSALAGLGIPQINTVEDAINFLGRIGLVARRQDGSWKTFSELSNEEAALLRREIVLAMYGAGLTQDQISHYFCEYYTLPYEEQYLKYADEFAYVLNACGNYDRVDVGIGVLLGNKNMYQAAMNLLKNYRQDLKNIFEIATAGGVKYMDHVAYFVLPEGVPPSFTGGVSTKLLTHPVSKGLPIVVCAKDSKAGLYKYSVRLLEKHGVTIQDIARELCVRVEGITGGGHKLAGGFQATIETPVEKVISAINEVLKEKALVA